MGDILNIVLVLPPAPAARVLLGRALATLSARSAAAFLRIAVFGPPGGRGDDGLAVDDPVEAALTGDDEPGDDCSGGVSRCLLLHDVSSAGCAGVMPLTQAQAGV